MSIHDETLANEVSESIEKYIKQGYVYDLRGALAICLGVIQGKYESLNNQKAADAIDDAHNAFMDSMDAYGTYRTYR